MLSHSPSTTQLLRNFLVPLPLGGRLTLPRLDCELVLSAFNALRNLLQSRLCRAPSLPGCVATFRRLFAGPYNSSFLHSLILPKSRRDPRGLNNPSVRAMPCHLPFTREAFFHLASINLSRSCERTFHPPRADFIRHDVTDFTDPVGQFHSALAHVAARQGGLSLPRFVAWRRNKKENGASRSPLRLLLAVKSVRSSAIIVPCSLFVVLSRGGQ